MKLTITTINSDEVQKISDEIAGLAERDNQSKYAVKLFVNDFVNIGVINKKLFDFNLRPTAVAGELSCDINCTDIFKKFVAAVRARKFDDAAVIHKKLLDK